MPDFNLSKAAEWPYPVNYGKENEVDGDILILGGGVAGAHAAIAAAKCGAKVVADKGAVAMGDYDYGHQRGSVSLITRLGHKDDALAREAAYLLSKSTRRPVCVIAGVHLDDITGEEIDEILANTRTAISEIINACTQQKRVN
jgi:anaerobic glycerol-3-phosphate dehydrogenase